MRMSMCSICQQAIVQKTDNRGKETDDEKKKGLSAHL